MNSIKGISLLELEILFTKSPVPMFILEEDYSVFFQNDEALVLTTQRNRNPEGKRLGDILYCINALNSSTGCGSSDLCSGCGLRDTVEESFKRQTNKRGVEVSFIFLRDKKQETIWLRLSTSFISGDEKNRVLLTLEDITEQKETEKKLRLSEERYSSIFKSNNSIMLLIDPETGQIEDANPAALKFYGWNLEEFRKKNIHDINTMSSDALESEMKNAVAEKRQYFKFRHQRADASIKDIEVYTGPVELGNRSYLLSIIHDISDRVLAEKKLEDSERATRALINANTETAFLVDREGLFIYMNDTAARRLQKSREELIGQNCFDLLPPDLNKSRKHVMAEVLKTGKPIRHEDMRNGRFLDNNAYPILDDHGEVIQVALYSRDVTAERTAELELRQSEEKYRFITEKTADVIYRIDLMTEKYTYASPSVERVFGYSSEECLELHARDILTEKSYNAQKQILLKSINEKSRVPTRVELELIRKDGGIIIGEINANLVYDNKGVPVEILGIARDITERKRADEEKEKLINELQEALREIKTLSSLIPICSHCKKIRDDSGYWNILESYFESHTGSKFSHGLCPECAEELYGGQEWFHEMDKN